METTCKYVPFLAFGHRSAAARVKLNMTEINYYIEFYKKTCFDLFWIFFEHFFQANLFDKIILSMLSYLYLQSGCFLYNFPIGEIGVITSFLPSSILRLRFLTNALLTKSSTATSPFPTVFSGCFTTSY